MGDSERPALDQRKAEQLEDALDRAKNVQTTSLRPMPICQ
jgi:hypothetical protein